jgi:hypothetical protein
VRARQPQGAGDVQGVEEWQEAIQLMQRCTVAVAAAVTAAGAVSAAAKQQQLLLRGLVVLYNRLSNMVHAISRRSPDSSCAA